MRDAVSDTDTLDLPVFADVLDAQARIAPHVRRTEVLTSEALDRETGAALVFKCENLQPPGAFKVRGACNAVFALPEAKLARGVATHSSGNHASSLAYAARRRGIPCHVVMPRTANPAKMAAVRAHGGRVSECAPSTSAREAALAEVQAATGAEVVHPYADRRVIAGQATCARELLAQASGLDAVLAPIGGGGLIAGTCLTVAATAPGVAVYAAEPAQADDAQRSLRDGRLVPGADAPDTVADGLKAPLKPITWHFVAAHVADILTVQEDEIVAAMKLAWQHLRLVVEPSSAVALAAIRKHPEVFAGKRVGVVLTGGNVDLDRLPWRP